ncbi:MAG: hypothetical protein ACXVJL_04665 [Candidatus Angelobacter sp.]
MGSRSTSAFRLPTGTRSLCGCTPSRYSTRLQLGGYVADIVPDEEGRPCVHHCIVQRIGSPKVLYLGQEDTFAAALACGHRQLEQLATPHRKKTGAIYEFTTADTLK